jgi:hypothetical protein
VLLNILFRIFYLNWNGSDESHVCKLRLVWISDLLVKPSNAFPPSTNGWFLALLGAIIHITVDRSAIFDLLSVCVALVYLPQTANIAFCLLSLLTYNAAMLAHAEAGGRIGRG